MQLKAWILENEKSMEEVAAALGCGRMSVYNWINGSFKPSKAYIRIIKIYTNNQVTEKDFKKEKNNV